MKSVPAGFRLVPDRTTRTSGDVVWGRATVLRLTPAGMVMASRLLAGEEVDQRSGALARRLLNAGLAHPAPTGEVPDLEVVVPARDRVAALDRCLEALAGLPVTVVDDASRDGGAVADVARRRGAKVVRRPQNGGPGAARNTGLAAATSPCVAFVDSDVVTSADGLRQMARHLNDPVVAAVAPRITDPLLDMGPHPANVKPGWPVPYVPATVLLVRRTDVMFDEALRYGEDVDLVWRLVGQGWSVRYEPAVTAEHRCDSRLARRFAYGTSVGPLSRRHPDALRGPALGGFAAPLRTARLRRAGLPAAEVVRLASLAPARTAAALLRWAVPSSVDDVAYTLGMWRGCAAARTVRPFLPTL